MTVVPDDVVSTKDRISGWVLKGSEVVHALACRRYGVLENDVFYSFRHEKEPKPSGRYPLHPRCEVESLEQRDILVRAKGKSTFLALVAGKYEKIDGYQFSVTWPGQGQSRQSKNIRLVLGFESETTAARWQTGFLQSIERLAMVSETEISSPPMPMPVGSPQHVSETRASKRVEDFMEGPSAFCGQENEACLSARESQTLYHDAEEGLCRSTTSDYPPASVEDNQSNQRLRSYGFWSPWKLVNGLAIYKEDDPSEGIEAFMVSCIVRATPRACFTALMANTNDRTTGTMGFLNMDVIDKIDEHLDLVQGRIQLNGWLTSLLAAREIVLDRSWRQEEEDGTYVVVMKSSDKFVSEDNQHNPPAETIGQYLWDPIRSQVLASVFTIAPLQDRYFKSGTESSEALVTMVLKMNLAGVLTPGHLLSPLLNIAGVKDAWIESILMNVMALKDRVEQARFVSPPFSSDSILIPQTASVTELDRPTSSLCHWTTADQTELSRLPSSVPSIEGKSPNDNAEGIPPCLSPTRQRSTGTLDPRYWTCPGTAGYRVRGPNYLIDKKKIPAGEPMFQLNSVDLVRLKLPTRHIAQYLTSVQNSTSPFSFVVQIMVPGPPHLALVITWGTKEDGHSIDNTSMNLDETENGGETEHELPPFDLTLMRFFTGDDETRNSSFKLIPHIINGSFIIRQSVGSTPVLLGHKLKQYYYKSAKYIEVDVDVGSSYTAATVVNMVSGVTKTLVVDMAIVLEGKTQQELPEALLGTVRLDHLDLNAAVDLDTVERGGVET